MRKVVLDTNVIVSGTLTPHGGHPTEILNAWRDGLFDLIIMDELIEEVKNVLNDPVLRAHYPHLTRSHIGELINLIRKKSIFVRGVLKLEVGGRDPSDDKFVIAALEGEAQFIVSGDDDLLSLKTYQGIKILTPVEFAKLL